jgi:hypothetical protein
MRSFTVGADRYALDPATSACVIRLHTSPSTVSACLCANLHLKSCAQRHAEDAERKQKNGLGQSIPDNSSVHITRSKESPNPCREP